MVVHLSPHVSSIEYEMILLHIIGRKTISMKMFKVNPNISFLGVGVSPCDVGGGTNVAVTIATQTGVEEAPKPFDITKLSVDTHCYECKVKYRDPRPKDLVMFLHAYTYSVRYFPFWQAYTGVPQN